MTHAHTDPIPGARPLQRLLEFNARCLERLGVTGLVELLRRGHSARRARRASLLAIWWSR